MFNIVGVAYGSSLFMGFANAAIMQPVVAMERAVFYRERSAGMYSSMPYAIAQVSNIPMKFGNIKKIFFFLILKHLNMDD